MSMIVTAGAFALSAAATIAWSQSTPASAGGGATTRPQQSPVPFRTDGGERRLEGRGDGMRGFRGGNEEWRRGDARPDNPNFAEPSKEEWEDVRKFMDKYSPKRLARMEDIADDTRQQFVRNMAAARYRAIQEIKQRDEKLYEIRLKRMKIEDDVFALSWDAKGADKPEKPRAELRSKLREMVLSSLEERKYHLQRAAERLKQSQKEIQEDEQDQRIDAAVDAKMREMDDDRWPRDLRPPRRPREADEVNAAPAEGKRQDQ
jgi:hypothetical protein